MKLRLGGLVSAILLASCGGGSGGGVGDITDRNTHKPVRHDVSGSFSSNHDPFVADSDSNDPNTTPVSNNTRDEAQAAASGAIMSGYVNTPGQGPAGPLYGSGDSSDFYFVQLASGDQYSVIFNIIGDTVAEDTSLNLYSVASNTLVESNSDTVTAPSSGNYFLEVKIGNGAANYLLKPGAVDSALARTKASSSDIVPGDVIVKFKSNPNARSKFAGTQKLSLNNAADLSTLNALDVNTQTISARTSGDAVADQVTQTLSAVEQLKQRADVEYATVNHYFYTQAVVPNDPLYAKQWDMPLINMPKAWELAQGSGVIVAVVDSGIVASHPDLKRNLLTGCNFTATTASCGDATDPGGDKLLPNDKSAFHGTHVAGTIAAVANNAQGVAGVAGMAQIMPLRALDSSKGGVGTWFDIAQACLYAARLPNSSGKLPVVKADVINMSLANRIPRGPDPYEQDVMEQLDAAGVIVVAAAGNTNSYFTSYPASYPTVISVAAVDRNKDRAPYSSMNEAVSVAAPGGDLSADLNYDKTPDGILSTHAAELGTGVITSYNYMQGTSMASPHMAGVAALMRSINPNLTPLQLRTLISDGKITEELGIPGHDATFGWGLIDAYKAVVEAARLAGLSVSLAPPELSVSATSINFNKYRQVATISVSNAGLGSLNVTSVASNASWLTVTATSVDSDGLGQYTLSADRSGLVDGDYSATVLVQSSAGNQNISIDMSQSADAPPSSYGYIHLQVNDLNSGEVVYSTAVNTAKENAFSFTLPDGSYEFLSGQDNNGNGTPCEFGELCYYPSADSQVGLNGSDRSGLNLKLQVNSTPQ